MDDLLVENLKKKGVNKWKWAAKFSVKWNEIPFPTITDRVD